MPSMPKVQQAETFTGEPQRVEWMLSAHQSLRDVTAMTMDMEVKGGDYKRLSLDVNIYIYIYIHIDALCV